MELFLDVFNISQYQHGLVISKQSFRRNIHIQHAVAPQCHDIYIIFLSDVQFSNRFSAFLDQRLGVDPLTCEYYLPSVANAQIQEGLGTIQVLPTHETWYGVTYREDLKTVVDAVADMKRRGLYPQRLWEE